MEGASLRMIEFSGDFSGCLIHSSRAALPILPINGQGEPAIQRPSNTRTSWQRMLIPATFSPIPNTDLASLIRSQFKSRVVVPPDTPKTPVCSAALVPVWQMSELLTTMLGLLAVGGVLSTTVLLLTVLEDTVADVTVSAAWTMPVVKINISTRISVANAMIKFLYAIVGTF